MFFLFLSRPPPPTRRPTRPPPPRTPTHIPPSFGFGPPVEEGVAVYVPTAFHDPVLQVNNRSIDHFYYYFELKRLSCVSLWNLILSRNILEFRKLNFATKHCTRAPVTYFSQNIQGSLLFIRTFNVQFMSICSCTHYSILHFNFRLWSVRATLSTGRPYTESTRRRKRLFKKDILWWHTR